MWIFSHISSLILRGWKHGRNKDTQNSTDEFIQEFENNTPGSCVMQEVYSMNLESRFCMFEVLLPWPPGGLPCPAEWCGCSYSWGDWQAHGGYPGLCQAGIGRCLCSHAVHQLHGGSGCIPHLRPAELRQPSWVHWKDCVRQLPLGKQTNWGEASSGRAPRHHLQDGGWGSCQVRQAPPAFGWWLQGPNEHWCHCRHARRMEVGSQGSSSQAIEEGDEGLAWAPYSKDSLKVTMSVSVAVLRSACWLYIILSLF